LENLDTEVDINRAWETIRGNTKISAKESLDYCELQKNKPWFDEGCSQSLEQKKQAKRLQDPRERTGDKLNNINQ
jgi:hypothetical protein